MTKTQQAVQDLVNKHSKLHGDFERFGQRGAWERCEELFDAIMELAPIKLAELADDPEHPERRLAVMDTSHYYDVLTGERCGEFVMIGLDSLRDRAWSVVKMEDK